MNGFGLRRRRPDPPGPGQESVWDYPRPPRLEPDVRRVTVVLGGVTVADTTSALRVLETSHPPTYYLPLSDVTPGCLEPAGGSSWCEWKGSARYWTVRAGDARRERAAWGYPSPSHPYEALAGHVAFYCADMDRCEVGGEVASPQPGGFYGGVGHVVGDGPVQGRAGDDGLVSPAPSAPAGGLE